MARRLSKIDVTPACNKPCSAQHRVNTFTHSTYRVAAATLHKYHHAYALAYICCNRRSVIAVLALTAGAAAFVAPQHPATGKALRAAAIEEEPAAPKYPTVNVRRSVACYEST